MYAQAPLDVGSYWMIGFPKPGASDNRTVLGITVPRVSLGYSLLTSASTSRDRLVLASYMVSRTPVMERSGFT